MVACTQLCERDGYRNTIVQQRCSMVANEARHITAPVSDALRARRPSDTRYASLRLCVSLSTASSRAARRWHRLTLARRVPPRADLPGALRQARSPKAAKGACTTLCQRSSTR